MAKEYLAIVEEVTPGVDPSSGYLFPPCAGDMDVKEKIEDKLREEFRGEDDALGNLQNHLRESTEWSYSLKTLLRPGREVGLLDKHAMGKALAPRTTVDATGKKGIIYPVRMPYGTGNPLTTKRIRVVPNLDYDGTTKCQHFGGGIVKGFTLESKRPGDCMVTYDIIGGPFIGSPGQTAIAGHSNPAVDPYNSVEVSLYFGATGITRTGTAPDFTDIAVDTGTATKINHDGLTLKFDNGLKLVDICDGLKGPAKVERDKELSADLEFSLDFTDPASGFSSYDEYVARFSGLRTNSFLIECKLTTLAGAATEVYRKVYDFPLGSIVIEPKHERKGKTTKCSVKVSALLDPTIGYLLGIFTVDQAPSY